MRRVLVTGSEGVLGKALRKRFEGLGDRVIGMDREPGADVVVDFDINGVCQVPDEHLWPYDVVICNAKCRTWEAHEALARRATSSIINIGSIYGVLGSDPKMYEGTDVEPTPAYYAAAKGALVSLTRWQATNLSPVRSNCVCPGGLFRNHSAEFVQRYTSKVPLGRMGTELDVVNAVEWLADDTRSGYITGQVLMVDGGLSVW